MPTGRGAHGLYPSRDARFLYVDEPGRGNDLGDRLRHAEGRRTWAIPGGGSPDMGGVSADGKVLWLSGRYNGVVYAISTATGRLLAKIPVGAGRTACASGRSRAAIRSATPASCAELGRRFLGGSYPPHRYVADAGRSLPSWTSHATRNSARSASLAITVVGAGTGFAVTKLHSGSASAATQPSVLRTGVTRDRGGFGFAAPPGGFGRRGPGFDGGGGLSAAATYLGLSTTELAAKLRGRPDSRAGRRRDSRQVRVRSRGGADGRAEDAGSKPRSRPDASRRRRQTASAPNLADRITALVNGQGFGFRRGFDGPGGRQRPDGSPL